MDDFRFLPTQHSLLICFISSKMGTSSSEPSSTISPISCVFFTPTSTSKSSPTSTSIIVFYTLLTLISSPISSKNWIFRLKISLSFILRFFLSKFCYLDAERITFGQFFPISFLNGHKLTFGAIIRFKALNRWVTDYRSDYILAKNFDRNILHLAVRFKNLT